MKPPHRLRRIALRIFAALLLLLALVLLLAWAALRASRPQLDGEIRLTGLAAPMTLARDALGTAVLRGTGRADLARGLGFLHAQERFFEMDLTRRSAAGELSALFGPLALERDRARRVHRMRQRLAERLAQMSPAEQALLAAYAAGVNDGLAQLAARPWQYLLLRTEPQPWRAEDSLLVAAEMFWMLQGSSIDAGFDRAMLRERVGDALFEWLEPQGGRWDAALDGSRTPPSPVPGPSLLDLREPATRLAAARAAAADIGAPIDPSPAIGSNNWAVSAARSHTGAALLADDMHLSLSVPSIWYRAQFEIAAAPGAPALRAAGVTLPGLPALVVGSNGRIAWGFTNAYGQWFDWVRVPADADPSRLRHVSETIAVKGAAPATLDVKEFDGLPVARERDGQSWALRWIGDQGEAYNLALDDLLGADTVDAALMIAARAGMPQQNILVADRDGHIGWTIAGRLWARPAMAERHARFQAPGGRFPAWLAPADDPRRTDPADGQLWTANNRTLAGAAGAGGDLIGDGGFDLGARASQIRDRLHETPRFDEATLGAIHLDDEARFMQGWARRIGAAIAARPDAAPVASVLQSWNGRADPDQAGYRLVRSVRLKTLEALWRAWTAPLLGPMQADEHRRIGWHSMFEYPATQALDERPAHLLPPGFADWDAFLRAQVDAAVKDLTSGGTTPLAQATWGRANASRIQHVLSRPVPALAPLLDLPSRPQGGDSNLPHVAQPSFGQSERLVVSPGHEESATLSMPGGQSGHPLSPHYGAGHADWVAGRQTPLLAGPAMHQMQAIR